MSLAISLSPLQKLALVVTLALTLGACSPAFNWREVRPENTRLSLLLPCKPDKAEKVVPLGGQPTSLLMMGCVARGETFAIAVADVGDMAKVEGALAGWQALTLANMRAPAPGVETANASTTIRPFKVAGASTVPAPVLVTGSGKQADGTPVAGRAVYFAQGSQVFQAVVYAEKMGAEEAETFFASLKFE